MSAPLILAKPRAARMLSSNIATRYEAALLDPAGAPAAILAYDAKRTRRALFSIMLQHGPEIVRLSDMPEDGAAEWKAGAWTLPGGWRVTWTGATEFQRASEAALAAA